MTFRAGFFRAFLGVAAVWMLLSGCTPSGSGPLDEEKEPHYLDGKSRISSLDYKGAIESFEKALQVNPGSASAHFELAWLFDQKEVDAAAAIYHYDHYLKLRPNAQNADLAKQRITVCKQALAETVSLGPVTEKVQRQFEQIADQNKRLTEENKRLHEDLDKWSSYAARLQTLTNQTPAAVVPEARAEPATHRGERLAILPSKPAASGSEAKAIRTHSVKAGETPFVIARKYGVKLQALLAANPTIDPRRLKVGQVLRIPGT